MTGDRTSDVPRSRAFADGGTDDTRAYGGASDDGDVGGDGDDGDDDSDDDDDTAVFDPDDADGSEDDTSVFDHGAGTSDDAGWTDLEETETEVRYDRGVSEDADRSGIDRWVGNRNVRIGILLNAILGAVLLGSAALYLGRAAFVALVALVGALFGLGLFALKRYA